MQSPTVGRADVKRARIDLQKLRDGAKDRRSRAERHLKCVWCLYKTLAAWRKKSGTDLEGIMSYETGLIVCQTLAEILLATGVCALPYFWRDLCDLIRG